MDQGRDCSGLLSRLRQPHVFNYSVVFVIVRIFVVLLIFDFKLSCHNYLKKLYHSICEKLCRKSCFITFFALVYIAT